MRSLWILLCAAPALAACVAAPPPVYGGGRPVAAPVVAPVAVAPAPRADPYCREERQEARAAQGFANRQAREAAYYGGRRQGYEAAAAQSDADRQRRQAQRAC
jgi:hypothetical protein